MPASGEDLRSKSAWRQRLLDARRASPRRVHVAQARALAHHVISVPGHIVCGYLPIGTEPGTIEMLDALLADGRQVLLPVVSAAGPLDWARYQGPAALAAGPFGLREPTGPRLGAAVIGSADSVLLPALAVDRHGVRLGRGGGHYDRSLPLAGSNALLIAVVRDEELVAELPREPHDMPVRAILTPQAGLVYLQTG